VKNRYSQARYKSRRNMIAALVAALIVSGAASAAGQPDAAARISPPSVPVDLEPPAGFRPFLVGHAVGTQNYICTVTPAGIKWLFVGPQATLFTAEGRQITTHFQSRNPFKANALHATWQHSRDSSVVWAVKFEGSSDENYVSPTAIEWLLLEVTGWDTVEPGSEKLAGTRYIQRVHTVGGREPDPSGCKRATLTRRELVPYEADYYFYR
jgi:Protein of unknown function (DUF3455)